jgi:hypothetical protein
MQQVEDSPGGMYQLPCVNVIFVADSQSNSSLTALSYGLSPVPLGSLLQAIVMLRCSATEPRPLEALKPRYCASLVLRQYQCAYLSCNAPLLTSTSFFSKLDRRSKVCESVVTSVELGDTALASNFSQSSMLTEFRSSSTYFSLANNDFWSYRSSIDGSLHYIDKRPCMHLASLDELLPIIVPNAHHTPHRSSIASAPPSCGRCISA